MSTMTDRNPENPYRELPAPIRVEDMITSHDVVSRPVEKDDYWREVEWMLRTVGVG
ncbi:MAG TPA: hypothetical protein VFG63_03940 [Nocardioidaceae bacterium]|nr:hypothetical protein [Nocardioidaceae bacterium]